MYMTAYYATPQSHKRDSVPQQRKTRWRNHVLLFRLYSLSTKKQPHVSVCLWACGYKRWSWLWLKTKWPHLSIRSPIQIYCSAIVLQYYSLPCHIISLLTPQWHLKWHYFLHRAFPSWISKQERKIISRLADTEIAQWISCLRWMAKARSETPQFTVQYHTQQMWQHDEIKMQYPNQKAIDMMEVKLSFLYCLLTASQWFLIYKPWLPQMSSSPLKPQPSGNSEILPPGIQCKNKLA